MKLRQTLRGTGREIITPIQPAAEWIEDRLCFFTFVVRLAGNRRRCFRGGDTHARFVDSWWRRRLRRWIAFDNKRTIERIDGKCLVVETAGKTSPRSPRRHCLQVLFGLRSGCNLSCRVKIASASGNNAGVIAVSTALLLGPKRVTSIGARRIASVARALPHCRSVNRFGGADCLITAAGLLRGARTGPTLYRLEVGLFWRLHAAPKSDPSSAGAAPPSASPIQAAERTTPTRFAPLGKRAKLLILLDTCAFTPITLDPADDELFDAYGAFHRP